jgi:hypothetical protein
MTEIEIVGESEVSHALPNKFQKGRSAGQCKVYKGIEWHTVPKLDQ